MKINQKQKDETRIFELSGELDFHTSPSLRDQLHDVLDKKSPKVIVNLKKVSYIDSSGLATFVEAFQKIKRYNGKLVLTELGLFEESQVGTMGTLKRYAKALRTIEKQHGTRRLILEFLRFLKIRGLGN